MDALLSAMRAAEDGDAGGFPLEVASDPRSLSELYFSPASPVLSRAAAAALASAAARAALIASASAAEACTSDSTPFAFLPTTYFSVLLLAHYIHKTSNTSNPVRKSIKDSPRHNFAQIYMRAKGMVSPTSTYPCP
jgi:hypothetical protein